MFKLGDFVLSDFLKESTDSSSKRLVLFMSATAMSLGVLILTIASFYTTVADSLMWALTIPLSTMAGVSYASVEKERLKLAQMTSSLKAQQNTTADVAQPDASTDSTSTDNTGNTDGKQ